MDDLDPTACFLADSDDLLNFSLEDEEEKDCNQTAAAAGVGHGGPSPILSSSLETSKTVSPYDFPEPMEEELEWISNKDAFPGVETCFGIFVDNPLFDQKSPVSVLENSSSNSTGNAKKTANAMISVHLPVSFPRRQRSKDMRRPRRTGFGELPTKNCLWVNSVKGRNSKPDSPFLMLPTMVGGAAAIGRRCQHCGVDKTPQWRAGPMGPKTLCNACGVRFKSGRLLPEYRPANSPTFSAVLHSNSHRKVLEMRRHKEACG